MNDVLIPDNYLHRNYFHEFDNIGCVLGFIKTPSATKISSERRLIKLSIAASGGDGFGRSFILNTPVEKFVSMHDAVGYFSCSILLYLYFSLGFFSIVMNQFREPTERTAIHSKAFGAF